MILIVDDLKENILSLKSILELHKFEVDTAYSGEEALKKILKNDYTLIILDVQMPQMDGFEVAEAISGYSKTKDTPIIFLTAVNIDKRFITKGYRSGAIDYVTKPFDPDILLLKVKTFHRLAEQTQTLQSIQQTLRKEIDFRTDAESKLQQINQLLELKVAERTANIIESNKLLERKNLELQQFAYVSSHDLKEPLRKIQVFTDLIRSRHFNNNDDAMLMLERIHQASVRMSALIDGVLQYSRTDITGFFQPISLNEIINEVINDLEILFRESDTVITVQEIPIMEAIDVQMRQLFTNLVTNAIKFSKKTETPVISINATLVNSEGHETGAEKTHCQIVFSDNGIGFEQAYEEKIFALFQRLHPTSDFEGTGIGLAIVKKIIDTHRGSVAVKSIPNKGTSFIITLPITQQKYSTHL